MNDYNPLTPEEEAVIVHKNTEAPFTEKNTRHCVNSISLKFIQNKK